MGLEERDVSGVGAIQGRLAVAGHHDIKDEVVAVFIGIHPERAELERLLRLTRIFEGKAQEGGTAGSSVIFALGLAASQRALPKRAKSASACCLSG
jgi:hypothetical protein